MTDLLEDFALFAAWATLYIAAIGEQAVKASARAAQLRALVIRGDIEPAGTRHRRAERLSAADRAAITLALRR